MERYQRLEKADVPIRENEIRITSKGLIRNYNSYSSLLQERQVREIILKAMGQAISKTVVIAEIIKKRMPRLHQDTTISSVSITDIKLPFKVTRPSLSIAISSSNIPDKHVLCIILSMKILMAEEGVEGEGEGEAGVGEDMEIIKG